MGGVGYKGINDFFAENETVYAVGAVRQASGKISVTVMYPSGDSFDFNFEPLDNEDDITLDDIAHYMRQHKLIDLSLSRWNGGLKFHVSRTSEWPCGTVTTEFEIDERAVPPAS